MQFSPLCTPDMIVKSENGEGMAKAVRCKRWSCEVCAQINRRKVIGIARRAKPKAMLTLTVSSKDYPNVEDAAEALKHGLRLLRLRLKRHGKLTNFQFLAVFEKHKSGHPHLHLLIRGKYIPWKWLRTVWEGITGSYQVDIRKIESEGMAAFYCAKYIGKDLSAFQGCKRWWRSHQYSEEDVEIYVPEWAHLKPIHYMANVNKLRFMMLYEGWQVEKEGQDGIRWREPPNNQFGYADLIALAEGRVTASLLRKDAGGFAR